MRILLAVVFIFCAAIIYGRSEVVEIYKKPVPTKGAAIKPPLRMMPPLNLRPNPPTPEEIAAKIARGKAGRDYVAARDAYLAKLGFSAATNTAHLIADAGRLRAAAKKIAAVKPIALEKKEIRP